MLYTKRFWPGVLKCKSEPSSIEMSPTRTIDTHHEYDCQNVEFDVKLHIGFTFLTLSSDQSRILHEVRLFIFCSTTLPETRKDSHRFAFPSSVRHGDIMSLSVTKKYIR